MGRTLENRLTDGDSIFGLCIVFNYGIIALMFFVARTLENGLSNGESIFGLCIILFMELLSSFLVARIVEKWID